MSRFDSRTTLFSQDGRLLQVEYAIKAVTIAAPCLAILAQDGIVFVAQKKLPSKLSDQQTSEKIYRIDSHIVCAVSGLTSDANILIDEARAYSQKWLAVYDEPIPVEVLVQYISDVKQNYTHHGGLRPYGVSFLFGGWDAHLGFQLYQTDPSGNYSAWVATSIGGSAPEIASALKQNITDSNQKILLKEAQQYAVSALIKTTDITKVSSDKMEILTVVKTENGDIFAKYVSNAEVDAICKQLQDK